MLDEAEYARVQAVHRARVEAARDYRRNNASPLAEILLTGQNRPRYDLGFLIRGDGDT
jgi:hypothetical protein